MSTISFQLHNIEFKNKNGFETYFPYHTIISLIIGFHLGRHLGYIEMLNDAKVASLGFFKDNVCITRINKEKNFKIKVQVHLKFAQILPDYLDNLYVASLSGPLPSFFQVYPWSQIWPRTGRTHILHRLI